MTTPEPSSIVARDIVQQLHTTRDRDDARTLATLLEKGGEG